MDATGSDMYDVAVVGLGPSGRALASRCAAAGLSVLAVDPRPDAPWRQTLSLWTDQIPPWLSARECGVDVLAHAVERAAFRSPGRAVLDRGYGVLDNDRLREALPLGPGVTIERTAVDDDGLRGLTARAHRVVDCRGAWSGEERGGGRGGGRGRGRAGALGPLQTAYGIVLSAADAAPALGGEAALFMDWRSDHDDDDELGPTFLYAIPLGPDRVLLEETCLAGLPAPAPDALAARLRSRLLRRGVSRAAIDAPLAVERVRIPLLPRSRHGSDPRIEAFGTAGGHGHAATGYSVAAVLAAVPAAVAALACGYPIPAPRSPLSTGLHTLGLRVLVRADDRTLRRLFDAFGRLEPRAQRWFLEGATPSPQVARAMWGMWVRMPLRDKAGMVAAVLRRTPRHAGVIGAG